MATNQDELFDELGSFSKRWVAHGWSWDGRLECVASTFAHSYKAEARGLVEGVFRQHWNHITLSDAPPLVSSIASATGGVRSDQMLYSTPAIEGVVVYGLWWPWGSGGTNISMRVGLTGRTSPTHTMRLQTTFRAAAN